MTRTAPLAIALALAFAIGCGDGDDGSGPDGGGGSGVGDGGAAANNSCPLDYVFPPQRYGTSDVIRGVLVASDSLYFRTLRDLHRVPRAGGTPSQVDLMALGAAGLLDARLGEDGLVLMDSQRRVWKLPLAGGAPSMVATLPNSPPSPLGSSQVGSLVDGGTFWFWAQRMDRMGYDLHRTDLGSGMTTVVLTEPMAVNDLGKSGDRLFFTRGMPGRLHALPVAGGTPMAVEMTLETHVLAADEANVYAQAKDPASSLRGFIWRIPLAGGAPQQLIGPSVLFSTGNFGFTTAERHVFQVINASGLELWSLARASGALVKAGCVPGRGYTVHAVAALGNTAYVSVFESSTKLAGIARFTLP